MGQRLPNAEAHVLKASGREGSGQMTTVGDSALRGHHRLGDRFLGRATGQSRDNGCGSEGRAGQQDLARRQRGSRP